GRLRPLINNIHYPLNELWWGSYIHANLQRYPVYGYHEYCVVIPLEKLHKINILLVRLFYV
ncbi:MAG: hypothetical protein ACC651_16070, partial [Candidatus Scalindua sp.]